MCRRRNARLCVASAAARRWAYGVWGRMQNTSPRRPSLDDEVEHVPASCLRPTCGFPRGGGWRDTTIADDPGPWMVISASRRSWIEAAIRAVRSEEHTSELQSRFDLVCRL